MYAGHGTYYQSGLDQGLDGFFLFDAISSAVKAVGGAISGAVKAVSGVSSQTGSTTPIYQQYPPQPPVQQTNYPPWLIGGAAVLGVLLLTSRKR